MSQLSFTGTVSVGDVVNVVGVEFTSTVAAVAGLGNCRLLHAGCVPTTGNVVGVEYPEPEGP